MKEEVISVSDTQVKLVCTFDANDIATEKKSVIKKICSEASLPGFRRGKVPRDIVLSKFRKEIGNDLASNIVNKSLGAIDTALKDDDVVVVNDIKRENNDGVTVCTLTIDVIPHFKLPDYKSIKIKPIDVVVTDSEVVDEEKRVLRQYAKYEVVDRAANAGDFVKLTYTGRFEDGGLVADNGDIPSIYGTQTSTWEEAGDVTENGIRAITTGIVGTKAGDKKTVSQRFEKNFKISQLQGKTINYAIEVLEVRECKMPELTNDLLKSLHADSLDDLREKIKNSITLAKTSKSHAEQREEIISKLLEMTEVKIPASAIEAEAIGMMADLASHQLKHGAKPSDIQARSKEIIDSMKPAATTRVKTGAILDSIAKAEKITIDNHDIENVLWQLVYEKGVNPDKYIAEVRKDRRKIEDIKKRAIRNKTLASLQNMICGKIDGKEQSSAN